MKRVLKPFAVWTLASCLTTLQFSSLAWAQDGAELKTTQAGSGIGRSKVPDLATPSMMVAPLKGFMADLGYSRKESEIQQKDLVGKNQTTTDAVQTQIAYGITPAIYTKVSYGYQNVKSRSDFALVGVGSISETNKEGVGDPIIGLGGRFNTGRMSVIGSLDYQISTGSAELHHKPSQVSDANGKTGGSEIIPQLTVFKNDKSEILFGASAGYDFRLERKISSKEPAGHVAELKETGGNTLLLSAFLESPQTTHSVGALLSYAKSDAVKKQSLGTIDVPGNEIATATAYANLRVSQNVSVLPSASYIYYMNDKDGETKLSGQNVYSGTLNLRLMF